MTEYDIEELYEAYSAGISEVPGKFARWDAVEEAYDGNARDHFDTAYRNGDIEIHEVRDGIRGDGSWPFVNYPLVWLNFNF